MGADSVTWGAWAGPHLAESGWPVHGTSPCCSDRWGLLAEHFTFGTRRMRMTLVTPSFLGCGIGSPPTSSPSSVPGIWRLLSWSHITLVLPHTCLGSQC